MATGSTRPGKPAHAKKPIGEQHGYRKSNKHLHPWEATFDRFRWIQPHAAKDVATFSMKNE